MERSPYTDRFTILGAGGFIGSNLVRCLTLRGNQVYAPKSITSEVMTQRHGHLVYCIGLTSDFRRRPLDTMQAHVCILRELLEHATFESLTYLSSTRVYRGVSLAREDVTLSVNPGALEDLYGISKLAGESLCFHSGRQNVKVVRLSNIVGPRNDRDLFIDEMLSEITTQRKLTLNSSPGSNKDYLYIDDAVQAIIILAESGVSGCFNVASGINVSNQEIIEHLCANFDFDLSVAINAPTIEFPVISIDKIRGVYDFQPEEFSSYFPGFIHSYKRMKGIR